MSPRVEITEDIISYPTQLERCGADTTFVFRTPLALIRFIEDVNVEQTTPIPIPNYGSAVKLELLHLVLLDSLGQFPVLEADPAWAMRGFHDTSTLLQEWSNAFKMLPPTLRHVTIDLYTALPYKWEDMARVLRHFTTILHYRTSERVRFRLTGCRHPIQQMFIADNIVGLEVVDEFPREAPAY